MLPVHSPWDLLVILVVIDGRFDLKVMACSRMKNRQAMDEFAFHGLFFALLLPWSIFLCSKRHLFPITRSISTALAMSTPMRFGKLPEGGPNMTSLRVSEGEKVNM